MIEFALIVVAALGVLVVAAVAVGGAWGRIRREGVARLYDLDEAVDFVAERLPPEVAARVSYEEVRAVLSAHLDLLEREGLARPVGSDAADTPPTPEALTDEEVGGWVIGRLAEGGIQIDDEDVWTILEVEGEYLATIGAVSRPEDLG
ncbi:MAG: hypothetical protein KatS3mg008_0597 [Acidimicrobiales bacterium]|nr:MAG: hypothetical protein KatS3mg008_0597 [Acidimicrobiales bacterium]